MTTPKSPMDYSGVAREIIKPIVFEDSAGQEVWQEKKGFAFELVGRLTKALQEVAREKDEEISRLTNAFKHMHQAKYIDGKLTDECNKCGLDIRESVHL